LLVVDRGFGVRLLQAERVPAFVVRARKNFVARRAAVPDYAGKGRPPERGDWVRPLARSYAGKETPATPPDAVTTWTEDGVELRGETRLGLVLPDAAPGGPTFRALAIHDPRYAEPLLLVTPQPLSARDARDLYHDRWPVEQLPLAGKQMVGAARQFVSEPETCQRLPELALVAGSVLTYLAATQPPIPAGFWDRNPKPTPGRLRRALAGCTFPGDYPLPERIRPKLTVTAHLRTGFFGQRRKRTPPTPQSAPATRSQSPEQPTS
jgi:hypothetical protein